MEKKISVLLEKLLNKRIDNNELEELYQILNDKEKEEQISTYLHQHWTEKDARVKIDSESILNEIKNNLHINNIERESDAIIFDYLTKSKSGRILSFASVLKYAAAIILAVLSTWLVIRSFDNKNLPVESQFNIISTPLGSKTSIILPDGTKIWLNSGSTLKYPVNFNEDERTAFLNGEAYFEVSKDRHKPFLLNTLGPKILVLGTKFNVKGYTDDKTVITTLFEGKIKLINPKEKPDKQKEYILHPEQEARFEKETNEITLNYIKNPVQIQSQKVRTYKIKENIESVRAWKEGKLIFESESIDEIVVKLHRWYGMNIHIMDDKLKSGTYSGTFKNNETIYQVLETINRITPIEINVKDNDIYISSKNE